MAKVTSKWSESVIIDREGRRIVKKYNTFEKYDLSSITGAFIQTVIEKRLQLSWEILQKRVEEESERLFIVVANQIGDKGTLYDPYSGTDYSIRVWTRLGRSYVKRKGHERFWFYKGNLRRWLLDKNNKPSTVFGKPVIGYARNPSARGWQKATISVNPYPNVKYPDFSNGMVRNALFGRRKVQHSFESNEELRPIISPTIKMLINNRLIPVMQKTIKGVVENGGETTYISK